MTAILLEIGGLIVVLAGQTFIGFHIGRIAKQLPETAKAFRDATTAMVIDLHDAVSRFELLVKEMKNESDAETGRVTASAPVPPNMPKLSRGARHAADPSGEYIGMPLREALHDNKTAALVLPAIVEERYVCHCTVDTTRPHCHYHGPNIPDGYDRRDRKSVGEGRGDLSRAGPR